MSRNTNPSSRTSLLRGIPAFPVLVLEPATEADPTGRGPSAAPCGVRQTSLGSGLQGAVPFGRNAKGRCLGPTVLKATGRVVTAASTGSLGIRLQGPPDALAGPSGLKNLALVAGFGRDLQGLRPEQPRPGTRRKWFLPSSTTSRVLRGTRSRWPPIVEGAAAVQGTWQAGPLAASQPCLKAEPNALALHGGILRGSSHAAAGAGGLRSFSSCRTEDFRQQRPGAGRVRKRRERRFYGWWCGLRGEVWPPDSRRFGRSAKMPREDARVFGLTPQPVFFNPPRLFSRLGKAPGRGLWWIADKDRAECEAESHFSR